MNYNKPPIKRVFLLLFGLIIVGGSMAYTAYLSHTLSESEEERVQIYIDAWESLKKAGLDDDVGFQAKIMETTKIPIITINEAGEVTGAKNFGENDDNLAYLENEVKELKEEGRVPIESFGNAAQVYYKNTFAYRLLTYYPWIQLLLLIVFVSISYMVFLEAQRNEQNLVWIGMSKETAHQLGTPISAISGWLELLKIQPKNDEQSSLIISEIEDDVRRLQLVSERFSKIGSKPELHRENLTEIFSETSQYMHQRAPKRVEFIFVNKEGAYWAMVNKHLLQWVLENIYRNALDSIDGEGIITSEIYEVEDKVILEITDDGKGIPKNRFEKIFRPGYSTKKRGWGLGLSLARRIIEKYHDGNIFVKKSTLGSGATFSIELLKMGVQE